MFTLRKISYVIALLSFPYLTLADDKDKGGVCYFEPPNVQPKKSKDNKVTLFGVDNFAVYATLGEMYYSYKGLNVEKSSDSMPFLGIGSQLTFNMGDIGKLFITGDISKTDKGRDHIKEIYRPFDGSPDKSDLNVEYSFERTDWSVSLGVEDSCFGLLSWKPLTCFMGYKSGRTNHYTKKVAYDNPLVGNQYLYPFITNSREQFETKGPFLGITLTGNPFGIWKNTSFSVTLAATKLNSDYKLFISDKSADLLELAGQGIDSTIGYTGKLGFSTSLGNNWTLIGTIEGFSYKLQSISSVVGPKGEKVKLKLNPIQETLVAGSLSFSKRW